MTLEFVSPYASEADDIVGVHGCERESTSLPPSTTWLYSSGYVNEAQLSCGLYPASQTVDRAEDPDR